MLTDRSKQLLGVNPLLACRDMFRFFQWVKEEKAPVPVYYLNNSVCVVEDDGPVGLAAVFAYQTTMHVVSEFTVGIYVNNRLWGSCSHDTGLKILAKTLNVK